VPLATQVNQLTLTLTPTPTPTPTLTLTPTPSRNPDQVYDDEKKASAQQLVPREEPVRIIYALALTLTLTQALTLTLLLPLPLTRCPSSTPSP
jgi:hypothetical protein